MNKYLSDKLKAISFLLMVMVVFLHSYNLEISFSSEIRVKIQGYNSFIQDLISQGITRIAVPLFFAISGYLFFINIKNGSFTEFQLKFRKRLKSLVLPYLFWSICGILLFLILQSVPISKPFFTNQLIHDYSIPKVISTVFINPIPHQLWFVRDLMVLVCLSPILYWLIKYIRYFVILIFLSTWICNLNYLIFSNEALLFFAVGAYLGLEKSYLLSIKLNNNTVNYFSLGTWIMLVVSKTIFTYIGLGDVWLYMILHKLSILVGIIAIWLLYDHLFNQMDISKKRFYFLLEFNFFLYAFHEPLLTIIKKAFYFIFGQSDLSSLINYLFAPSIAIFISILVGFYVKKYLPRYYKLITGGR